MYAVIRTGGKQYRVKAGDELRVEKLDGEVGDTVALEPVLLVGDGGGIVTGPDLGDQTVAATIVDHGRGKKIRVFTYKNKSRQRRTLGHRQGYTTLKIDEVPS